jgi:DNA-binding SARP family transcriptional activator
MTRLRFEILGPVRAYRSGSDISLGSPAQRTVLASLLLRPGIVVTLNSISRNLWHEEEQPTSNAGLIRTYVSRLRRELGPSAIERVYEGYRLPAGAGSVDLAEFHDYVKIARMHICNGDRLGAVTAFRSALDLWNGSAIMGTVKPFHHRYAEHLNELRIDALERCLAAELELGHHEEVVHELLTAVLEYPLREDLVVSCMTALQRCGRTAQAIAVYIATRDLLASELGIDPCPRLQSCYRSTLCPQGAEAANRANPTILRYNSLTSHKSAAHLPDSPLLL